MAHLRCAISPDADDLFMFRALIEGKVASHGIEVDVVTRDTDALNRLAEGEGPDVTAISIAHYPFVAGKYRLFNHGGSVGRGYGPVLVTLPDREGPPVRIGVPGLTTTACMALRMALPHDFEPVVLPITPPARTFEAVRSGEVDAAVVIHEGRLTYEQAGLVSRLDLGVWWKEYRGLPLPLGGTVIRRDLGSDLVSAADAAIHASIAWALDHREEMLDWLLPRCSLTDRALLDRYLAMYANADSLDYGDAGRTAVTLFLDEAWCRELCPRVREIDFVGR